MFDPIRGQSRLLGSWMVPHTVHLALGFCVFFPPITNRCNLVRIVLLSQAGQRGEKRTRDTWISQKPISPLHSFKGTPPLHSFKGTSPPLTEAAGFET